METPDWNKELGLDYERRVITPAVEETLKQVTATYNAEETYHKTTFGKTRHR